MISFLNEKLRWLLLVLLVVIGISFIFFGSWTPSGSMQPNEIGVIRNHTVRHDEFLTAQRSTYVAYFLRTGHMLESSSHGDNYIFGQTWSRMVALAAARAEGININDAQLLHSIRNSPMFFDEQGVFSSEKFQQIYKTFLQPMGISIARFQEIMREDLMIGQLLQGIGSTAVVSPAESQKALQGFFAPAEVKVVTFDFKKSQSEIQPTDSELKSYYDQNQGKYAEPERRNVRYVEFKLAPEHSAKTEQERRTLLTDLGKKAYEFAGNFLSDDEQAPLPASEFDKVAQQLKLTVRTAKNVERGSQTDFAKQTSPAVVSALFTLTPERAVTDYIATPSGFVVAKLDEVIPSRSKNFEQVKNEVRQDFLQERSYGVTLQKALQFRNEALKQLKEGKSWGEITQALKPNTETLSQFIPASSQSVKHPAVDVIRLLAQHMEVGELSSILPYEGGAVMVYLQSRGAVPQEKEKEFSEKIYNDLLQQRRGQLVNAWLNAEFARKDTRLPEALQSMLGAGQ